MVDLTWILTNIGEIGLSGILIVAIWFILDEKIVLGPFHRREVATGQKAIETLEKLNPQLQEFEKLAAVQKVRDEYGAKEVDEIKTELRECISDLGQCREQSPGMNRIQA